MEFLPKKVRTLSSVVQTSQTSLRRALTVTSFSIALKPSAKFE